LPKEKTKVCIGCFYPLPLSKFNKYEWGIEGVRARCKKCFSIHRKGGPARTAKRKALLAQGKRPCNGCGKAKALSNFQPKIQANGEAGWEGKCKPCVSKRQKKNHFARNKSARQLVFDYLKKHPCIDCGENNILALEFDHTHSKKFDIGTALNGNTAIDLLQKEMKKCVVRCSTCHRIKTHLEINSWRFQFALEDKETSRKVKSSKQYKKLMKVG
jgi:Zn-finger protein